MQLAYLIKQLPKQHQISWRRVVRSVRLSSGSRSVICRSSWHDGRKMRRGRYVSRKNSGRRSGHVRRSGGRRGDVWTRRGGERGRIRGRKTRNVRGSSGERLVGEGRDVGGQNGFGGGSYRF